MAVRRNGRMFEGDRRHPDRAVSASLEQRLLWLFGLNMLTPMRPRARSARSAEKCAIRARCGAVERAWGVYRCGQRESRVLMERTFSACGSRHRLDS